MHRNGHFGVALLAYAPLGMVVRALGIEAVAVGGALFALALAMLPDYDLRLPGVPHRGPTHTVRFAGYVAVACLPLGAFIGWLHPDYDLLAAVGLGLFLAVVGAVSISSHIAADALTPMGVEPFGHGRHYSYGICRADSTLWNYGLLGLGLVVGLLANGIGAALSMALGT